ncbi:ribosomal protein S5 domain 2-type protein [Catenaria anguillulae PL171]|uniref:Ribosomal protein S5 domain 2-type protein n=1 Tax=Catenaria anguillulae PL171 TaxID=765915 RepID=A0A1Y2I5Y4_9FUNG|nr:ribosomal protein S5 domain 2-type protein [Catenaria anguillulae PL171]
MSGPAPDRKRIPAPQISLVPLPLDDHNDSPPAPAHAFSPTHRPDGRSATSLRPLVLLTGTTPRADGSALVELGRSKVVAAVYGPRADRKLTDPDQGRLNVDFRLATYAQKQRRGWIKSDLEKEYTKRVLDALLPSVRLEAFPKSMVDVHVNVLEEDGELAAVAAGITAASLALADAGIELFDLVAGVSAGFVASSSNGDQQETVVMDLTGLEEEKHASGTVMVAYMANVNQIAQYVQSGSVKEETAEVAMDYCVDAAAETHALMGKVLAASAASLLSPSLNGSTNDGVTVVDNGDDMEVDGK